MVYFSSQPPALKAPPLTHAEFRMLVRKVSSVDVHVSRVDRKVLSALVQVAYYCGLKRQELIDIKIRDVLRYINELKVKPQTYTIRQELKKFFNVIDGYEYPVLIENDARRVLQAYLKYLLNPGSNNHNYFINPGSPLFPQNNRAPYSENNLRNHLGYFSKHISPASAVSINFESIRQSGIFYYYMKRLKRFNNYGAAYNFGRVVEFARNKRQHVYSILF